VLTSKAISRSGQEMSSWFLSEACSSRTLSKCIKGECREENRCRGLDDVMPGVSGCVGGRLVASFDRERNRRTQQQYVLSPNPTGATVGSYSTISANAEARTPTSKFDFNSYVNYNKYLGPGASTLPETESLSYGFNGHFETYGKNTADRSYLDAGYSSG